MSNETKRDNMNGLTILGCDMGTRTFTVTVVSYQKKKIKLIDTFHFPYTIDSLIYDNMYETYPTFVKEFNRLLTKYKPTEVYAERFMVRGRMTGGSAELVSYMMGIMCLLCVRKKIEFVPVTAASWKNRFNALMPWPSSPVKKSTPLKEYYNKIKPTQPHFLDSGMIAVYGIGYYLGLDNAFSLVKPSFIDSICKKERANHEAIKRKNKRLSRK